MTDTNRSNAILIVLILVTLFIGVLVMLQWTRRQASAAEMKRFSHYSAQQMIARSEAICTDIAPTATNLAFTAYHYPLDGREGEEGHRTWEVDYEDATTQERGAFVWNADNGALEQVSHSFGVESQQTRTVSASQAVVISRLWIERLPIGSGRNWTLLDAPEHEAMVWKCQFRSSNISIMTQIMAGTGDLAFARIVRH